MSARRGPQQATLFLALIAWAIFAMLFLSGCASQLVEIALGPATTAPQQVFRIAGVYNILLKRLAIADADVITPRVRLANTRADDALKDAYAAVSASNAPPNLDALVNESRSAMKVLAAVAKATDFVQNMPGFDPIGAATWGIGKLVNVGPITDLYRAEIDKLNVTLNDMFVERRDPTRAEWDALWAAVAAGQARLAAR